MIRLSGLTLLVVIVSTVLAQPASALSIQLGALTIDDNDAHDIADQTDDVIRFQSDHPTKGFALPQGNSVSLVAGVLRTMSGAAGLDASGEGIVLSDFVAVKLAGAGNAPLEIVIKGTVDFGGALADALVARDVISGELINAIQPFQVAGDEIVWQGFANGNGIEDSYSVTTSGEDSPVELLNVDDAQFGGPAGGATLEGHLDITIGVIGDRLSLPASAEVGVAPSVDIPALSEVGMILLALVVLIAAVRRVSIAT